jgi:epoxyqueuosine reductase
VLVDHGPLAERAYARAAGLGWQGKNTMLLARGVGSYTFLAAILTSVELEPDSAAAQTCGACTRCLPACPTGALRSEYELVNDLCIAYQTIENRGPIPRELRPRIGDWVFGCDLCQQACPVNDADVAEGLAEFSAARSEDAFPDLVELLSLSEAEFRARFARRALLRAQYAGLLRNACVVLGNLGDARACGALAAALDHPKELVRGHAAWALGRLASVVPLRERLAREGDPWVREEITQALEDAGA